MADSILIVETLRGELTIASPGTAGPRGLAGAAGPTAVSTDADNAATLGGDGLVFVPEPDAAPVDSVNTKTGAVVLDAADVGAAADDHAHAAADLSDSTPTGEAVVTAADAAAARAALGAGTSDFDGAYASLSGAPSLGTAAPLDVPASGDAAAGEVVKGDDSRLTDDRDPTAHSHPVAVGDLTDVTAVGEAVATAADQAAARTAIGAGTGDGTSDFDGAYANLTGTPTLGTAAALDVAATGDAAAGEVVKGSDTRLSDDRDPTAHASSHTNGGSDEIDVADLASGAATDGYVATADGAGGVAWEATALDDLSDVSTAGATSGQALVSDGTNWAPGDVVGVVTGPTIAVASTKIAQPPNTFTAGSAVPAVNVIYAVPLHIPNAFAADGVVIRVTTGEASATPRLGVYSMDPDTGYPSDLLVDGGQVDASTTGAKVASISADIPAGIVYVAVAFQGASSTLRLSRFSAGFPLFVPGSEVQFGGSNLYAVQDLSAGPGALPATWTDTISISNSINSALAVGIRRAS